MCGICGTVGFCNPELIQDMTATIHHRGPDDAGVFLAPEEKLALGNCRLSIIDLSSAGHMPMSNETGDVWITYNGEIYNFHELRRELEAHGHQFRSHTDTEVLVHGWEQWGVDLLPRLNGMFAFAIADFRGTDPTVVLARDRFGIKPLYYCANDGRLVFSSEIKSMLLAGVRREVNLRALHRFLGFRWAAGPETVFDGIYKLPPAHCLIYSRGQHSIRRYWELRYDVEPGNEKQLVDELRFLLDRTVTRHLISDVPLGVFLSGGVDSSTILALATRITERPVTAYTIGYRPQDGRLEQSDEDARFARLVAGHFGADYHEIVVEPKVVELLPKVIWHMDEPVADAAAISTYIICHAARENLKVLLSGQGGDEVFAGYRVYLGERLHRRLSVVPRALRGALRSALALLPRAKDCIPGVSPGLLLAGHRYFDKLLRAVDLSPEERFICAQTYLSDAELQELYTPELREQIGGYRAAARHLELFRDLPEADFLNRMLYVDMNTFLPELNLTYSDKMSAAASVEIRVPFLDTELVDFANRLHPDLKLKNLTSKYLLKRAIEGLLPHSVIKRRKAGFGAPIRAWLRNDLRGMVDSVLSEETLSKRGYFNPRGVRRMIERDRAGVEDYATRIWNLLTLELWLSTFIDPARIRPAKAGGPIPVSTRKRAIWHFQSNQTFAA